MAEPPAAPAAPVERDDDLELAMRLHRELNAVPRRQRQPARNQAASAALKTLTKKQQRQQQQDERESVSSESDAGPSGGAPGSGGGGGEPKGRRRRSADDGSPPSDNDSGSRHKRQREGQGPVRKPGVQRRPGRRPQHIAAAEEAKRKAAAAAAAAADAEGGPSTHIKCFFAGLQHGAWLAVDALGSRASLAAAVCVAFRDDGVSCSGDSATVVFVTADKQSLEFPGSQQQDRQQQDQQQQQQQAAAQQEKQQQADKQAVHGEAGGGSQGSLKWQAAARSAVRVYVR